MNEIFFSLNLSEDQYIKFYQGSVKFIQVKAEDGRNIKFPAKLLQKYITPTGIQGRFKMLYEAGQCQLLVKI